MNTPKEIILLDAIIKELRESAERWRLNQNAGDYAYTNYLALLSVTQALENVSTNLKAEIK